MSTVPGEVVNPDADGLVGGVTLWMSDSLPSAKYMFVEGALLTRTDYSLLFSRIGTRFNTGGEAATAFRLPNGKGKTFVGLDPANVSFDVIGETGGTQAATMPTHGHALSGAPGVGTLAVSPDPHSHTYNDQTFAAFAAAGAAVNTVNTLPTSNTGTTSLSITGAPSIGTLAAADVTGSGNNMPPYMVLRPIIKVL